MTAPAEPVAWIDLLDPEVRTGVTAAITKDPSLYADVLRRITGGAIPTDGDTARTVAQIILASSVGANDVDIATAAVKLGAYDADTLKRPLQKRAEFLPKGLALKFLEPKSVREVDLAVSTGNRYQELLANVIVEETHRVLSKILWQEFAKAFIQDGWSATLYYSMIGKYYREALNDKMAELMGLAASDAYNTMLPIGTTVTGSAKFLTPWANSYAQSQIETYDTTNAQAIQESLGRYMTQGLANQEVANRLRQSYGLDPKSAFALDAYRDSMTASRPGQRGIVQKLVTSYADKLLMNRAHTQSQTAAMTAMNFGRLLVYTSGMANGSMPVELSKVWLTAIDERVCPTCGPMDGVSVPMDQPFLVRYHAGSKKFKKASAVYKEGAVTELLVPPAHPNCRCTIVSDVEFAQGMITRTSRLSGRKVSDEIDLKLAKRYEESKHPRDLMGRFADKAGEELKQHPKAAASGVIVAAGVGLMAAKYRNDMQIFKITGSTFDDIYANAPEITRRFSNNLLSWGPERPARVGYSMLHNLEDHNKPGILHPSVWADIPNGKSIQDTMDHIIPLIKDKKHEFAFIMDEKGKIVAGYKGGDYSVIPLMPKAMSSEDKLKHFGIHNHPNAEELNGFSPLSPGDIGFVLRGDIGALAAIDNRGNITIAKGTKDIVDGGAWATGIQSYFDKLTTAHVLGALGQKITNEEIMGRVVKDLDAEYVALQQKIPGFYYIKKDWGGIGKRWWEEDKHKRDDKGRFSVMGIHPGDIDDWKSLDKKQKVGLSIAMLVAAPIAWEAGHIAGYGAVKGAQFVGERTPGASDFVLAYEKVADRFLTQLTPKPVAKSDLPDWTTLDIPLHETLWTPHHLWMKLKADAKYGPTDKWGERRLKDGSLVPIDHVYESIGASYLEKLPENWHKYFADGLEKKMSRLRDGWGSDDFKNIESEAMFGVERVLDMFHGVTTGKNFYAQQFQLATKRALNLDAPTLHFGAGPAKKRELLKEANNWDGVEGLKMDDVIKAQYAHTQEMLGDLKIDKVPLARGMTMTRANAKRLGIKIVDDVDDPMKSLWHEVEVPLQPVSSFTSNPKTAFEYAAGAVTPQRGDVAVIIRAVLPKEKILRSNLGGSPQEWWVLGGNTKFEAVGFDPQKLGGLLGEKINLFENDPTKLHKFAQRVWDHNIV